MQNVENHKNQRILIIDDNETIHEDFRSILCEQNNDSSALDQAKTAIFGEASKSPAITFNVDSAFQGEEGLEKIIEAQLQGYPYIMAFVDVRMPPGLDGIETIKRIWQKYPDFQIVICTAYSDYSWSDMINQLGQTDKLLILKKPFDNIEVRQIACSLREKWYLLNKLDHMVKRKTEQVIETRDAALFALAKLAESRDPETGEHLERIQSYCKILADQLALNSPYSADIDEQFVNMLYRSSPLHDIGKVGIPDDILLKPAKLTTEEFEIMKQHPCIGADALQKIVEATSSAEFWAMAADIARYHHERFDGRGYLDGLKGQEIPLTARIVALADVYDALINSRVYKNAFKPNIAMKIIEDESGSHFDPVIVEAFKQRHDEFLKVGNLTEKGETIFVESFA